MGLVVGWVAFALAGVASAPHANRDQSQITYTVRMVETEGVGWREGVLTRLKPVRRQGAATVWTIPRDASTRLLHDVGKSRATKIIQAPKVTSLTGAPATIQRRGNRQLVTQAAWNGEEPATEGSPENIRVGWHTTMVGRKLDQGILVQVVFEDTVIRAVHRVNANLDVPEIDTHEVLGEWLIPRGEALLVSFGADTVAAKDGRAVVKERFAIIEADLAPDASPAHGPGVPKPVPAPFLAPPASLFAPPASVDIPVPPYGIPSPPVVAPPAAIVPVPLHKVPMPSPNIPSRSIPHGVHADGTPAELPPLPADETETDSSASESSEPMPSPQTKKPGQTTPKPATDSGASKAEFAQPKSPTMFLPSLFLPSRSVGFQFLLPIKPLSFKLPFNQRIEIEIFGRIVPDP
jgi:hypothetical protein